MQRLNTGWVTMVAHTLFGIFNKKFYSSSSNNLDFIIANVTLCIFCPNIHILATVSDKSMVS